MMRLRATYARRAILVGLITAVSLARAAPQHLTYAESAKTAVRDGPHNVVGAIHNGRVSTKVKRGGARARSAVGHANPLWAIPLSSLSATRNRPIFSPNRRPSSRVLQSSVSPSRPPLALVGAITGQSEGVAIFLDKTTKRTIRLKTGESHLGWTLRRVKGREATLQNENKSAILELPSLPASRK